MVILSTCICLKKSLYKPLKHIIVTDTLDLSSTQGWNDSSQSFLCWTFLDSAGLVVNLNMMKEELCIVWSSCSINLHDDCLGASIILNFIELVLKFTFQFADTTNGSVLILMLLRTISRTAYRQMWRQSAKVHCQVTDSWLLSCL